MSRICKIQEGNLLSIEVKKDNILLFSDVFLAIHSATYLIEGLNKNSVYRLVVISNTSVGWKSFEVLLISKYAYNFLWNMMTMFKVLMD